MQRFRFSIWLALMTALVVLGACDSRRRDARQGAGTGTATSADVADPAVASQQVGPTNIPSTLRTRDGRTFEKAELVRAEPDGLLIVYFGPTSRGIAKLDFADLSDDIRRTFHYDKRVADKFKADRLVAARQAPLRKPLAAAPSVPDHPAVASVPSMPVSAPVPLPATTNTLQIEMPTAAEVESYDPDLAAAMRAVEASKPALPNLPIEMPPAVRQWYEAYCAKVRAEADAKMASTMRHVQELTAYDDELPSSYITNPRTGVVYPVYKLCIPTNTWGNPKKYSLGLCCRRHCLFWRFHAWYNGNALNLYVLPCKKEFVSVCFPMHIRRCIAIRSLAFRSSEPRESSPELIQDRFLFPFIPLKSTLGLSSYNTLDYPQFLWSEAIISLIIN